MPEATNDNKAESSKKESIELTKQEYDEYVKISKLLNRQIEAYDQIKDRAQLIRAAIKGMNNELQEMNGDLDYAAKRLRDSLKELLGQDQTLKNIVKSTRSLEGLSEKLQDHKEKISVMDEKELAKVIEKAQKEQSRLVRDLNLLATKEKITEEDRKSMKIIMNDLLPATEQILDEAEDRLAIEKHITKQMGLAGNSVKLLTKALDKMGMGSLLNMENISKKMREAAEKGKGKWKVLFAGLNEGMRSFGEALRDPMMQITAIYKVFEGVIKSAIAFQIKVHEAAKGMGMGVHQAERMFEKFMHIAEQNGKLAMTARQLAETYGKINDQLGIMGPQNEEFLTFANGIERRFGLGAAEMENISIYAASTGQSIQKTYGTLIATTKLNGLRLGFQMTEKQTMQAISKVSATIFNNFKGNVKQLALAVQTATKFGTTLDQINSAGMSLLDFESSIAKEFEAQLLTGKKIDLSKARQAALTKDTAGLMKEITSQLGSHGEWSKYNVLQQQSLAEAFGLSKESVDEMYRKQLLVNALGKEANTDAMTQYKLLQDKGYTQSQIVEMMGQQAVSDAMSASIQDKMAATMERVRDAIGEMTAKLIPFMEKIVDFLGNMENLKRVFSVILGIAGGLVYRSLVLSAKKKEEMASMAALQRQYMQQEMTANRTNVLLMRRQGIITQNTAREIFGNNVRRKGAIIDATSAGSRLTGAMAYLGPAAIALGLGFISSVLMNLGEGSESAGSSISLGSMSRTESPSTGIQPMNQAAAGVEAQTETTGKIISAGKDERPMNFTFYGQVVDTRTNIEGRLEKGISMDTDSKY